MVIKKGSNGKRHYILPVCSNYLRYFLRILYAGTPNFVTFGDVAHPPPWGFFFKFLFFNFAYAYI